MKNIRKFNTTVEMESAVLTEPYILYNEETDLVYINNIGSQPDMLKNYFRFTAVEDTSFGLNGMDVATSDGAAPDANIEISSDGATWNTWNFQPTELLAGETVYMRGNNPDGFSTINMNIRTGIVNMFILGDGKIECHGNIMSLLYADDFEDKLTIPSEWCFIYLFMACESLTTAPELPATTLTDDCYAGMFTSCTSLTTAPELPATTMANECYHGMFNGCTSLTTAPELPATTLAHGCYMEMFNGCTSLTTAPELPATTLTDICYGGMFFDCTSLTTAPELPATTLAEDCYVKMFFDCTSLTTAPSILPATTLADGCYLYMFSNCTSLTTAPELPASKIKYMSYHFMFEGCTNLNHITMLATDISESYNSLDNWVYNVSSTGTFVKHPKMTSLETGTSGIPNGWTVEDAVL